MDLVQSFFDDVRAGPAWVFYWVNFMGAMFALAIPFAFKRPEARWAVLAMTLAFPTMMWLYHRFDYTRILGLAHILFWTPLAVYLWRRRVQWRVRGTLSGKWLLALFATIIISLALDYADVFRYLAGDRS